MSANGIFDPGKTPKERVGVRRILLHRNIGPSLSISKNSGARVFREFADVPNPFHLRLYEKNWELGSRDHFRLACSPWHPVCGRELEKPNGIFSTPKEQNWIKIVP